MNIYGGFLVPGTGLEPAHPCERCDLNTVRLPISPPGQVFQGCKLKKNIGAVFLFTKSHLLKPSFPLTGHQTTTPYISIVHPTPYFKTAILIYHSHIVCGNKCTTIGIG